MSKTPEKGLDHGRHHRVPDLIDHFLGRGAHAEQSGDPQFADFTFDHEMNGVVVGEQQDKPGAFSTSGRAEHGQQGAAPSR